MTKVILTLTAQVTLAALQAIALELTDAECTVQNGIARITFSLDVERGCYDGGTEGWDEWCRLAVVDHIRSYCPMIDSGEVDASFRIIAQDAPEEIVKEAQCQQWSRSFARGYANR